MNRLKASSYNWIVRSTNPIRHMATISSDDRLSSSSDTTAHPTLPEEPTNCCMSGCANCVWIEYANELNKLFEVSGQKTKDIVLSKVTDPNMKAFLMMELKAIEKNKLDEIS